MMSFSQTTYYTYIVECQDKTLYTGITRNLEKRINQHNGLSWGGSKYARSRRPVRLVHAEEFNSKSEALKREFEIKGMDRKEKLHLIKEK